MKDDSDRAAADAASCSVLLLPLYSSLLFLLLFRRNGENYEAHYILYIILYYNTFITITS